MGEGLEGLGGFPEFQVLFCDFLGAVVLLHELNALLLHGCNLLLVLYEPFQLVIDVLLAWGYIDHWAQLLFAKDVVTFGLGSADNNLAF